jgi:hypothetical protein
MLNMRRGRISGILHEEGGIDPHLDFLFSKYFFCPKYFLFPNTFLSQIPCSLFLGVRADFESVSTLSL